MKRFRILEFSGLLLCLIIFQDCDKIFDKNDPNVFFTISPDHGTINTNFVFDPTHTWDQDNDISELEGRWDWESDGIWDTDFAPLEETTHKYNKPDSYRITLEVMDPDGNRKTNSNADLLVVDDAEQKRSTITFWTSEKFQIQVDVKGYDSESIVVWYEEIPSCDAFGCVTIRTDDQSITYSAYEIGGDWNVTDKVHVCTEGCNLIELPNTIDGGGVSEIIGVNGGSIEYESLELIFPANCFDKETEIEISPCEEQFENAFNYDSEEPVLEIRGIPEDFKTPIQIRTPLGDDILENIYFSVGHISYIKSGSSEQISSFNIPYSIDQEYYIGEINPSSSFGKNEFNLKQTDANVLYYQKGGVYGTVEDQHFQIFFDQALSNEMDAETVLNQFKNSYRIISEEISLNTLNDVSYPISVYLKYLKGVNGEYVLPKLYLFGDYLNINAKSVNNEPILKTTIIHELLHFFQQRYDPDLGGRHLWFDEATAIWSQSFVSNEYDPVYGEADLYLAEPFIGFDNISIGGYESHGYGMSWFVKYMSDKLGNNSISKVYDLIKYEEIYVLEAINSQFSTEPRFWYKDFIGELLEGKHGNYTQNEFKNRLKPYDIFREIVIASESDTIKTVSGGLVDLSTMLYNINLDFEYTDSDQFEMTLTGLGQHGFFEVYKHKGGKLLEPIAESDNTLTLADLKKLKEDGYNLLVSISNLNCSFPYDQNREFQFEVQLHETLDLSKIESCIVTLSNIDFNYDYTCHGIVSKGTTRFNFVGNSDSKEWVGTFDGLNRFEAASPLQLDENSDDDSFVYLMVDPEKQVLSTMKLKEKYMYYEEDYGWTNRFIQESETWDIPLVENNEKEIVFEVKGNSVKSHFVKGIFNHWLTYDDGQVCTIFSSDLVFNSSSLLRVRLIKEN